MALVAPARCLSLQRGAPDSCHWAFIESAWMFSVVRSVLLSLWGSVLFLRFLSSRKLIKFRPHSSEVMWDRDYLFITTLPKLSSALPTPSVKISMICILRNCECLSSVIVVMGGQFHLWLTPAVTKVLSGLLKVNTVQDFTELNEILMDLLNVIAAQDCMCSSTVESVS